VLEDQRARLICALRGIDDDSANGATVREVLARHHDRLTARARAIGRLAEITESYLENGLVMPDTATPRISQVTINATDLEKAVEFYQAAFGATYNEEITSLQFGTWPAGNFCLLTIAHEPNDHGQHKGPGRTARFGLLVGDIDDVHRRALDAGAREYYAPVDKPWKPRSSCVIDPSGNWIDLYQA
jgi:predicted enzyme related to lactoylglutathione lyase